MKEIRVLGMGCPKCKKLEETTIAAAKEMDIEFNFEKVSELEKIMEFGVMVTPALVVDGKVKVSGKVPKIEDLKKLLI